ncbi:HNH endonuclease [Halomonas nitroreducens]|uniref:Putative HNH nuclease YajD n=1 Tax=Halomonas nitroreducens TaxID=447425 RepID=A0A3S0HNY5_9GAMM|nr:HNH endonuclease [Halomonas nitroreducens]RTR01950.1 HNH endonuclease [Halomonas nitroreducens]
MPQRPAQPCRERLCRQLTRERHGYCKEHERLQTGWARHQESKSASQRGYGSRWRKLRQLVMERDRWLCQACRRKGRATPAAVVDHIVNKAEGGSDSPDNLEALCRLCHKAKTQQEAQRGRERGGSGGGGGRISGA